MPIFRSMRLYYWTTTLVISFLICCVLEFGCGSAGVVSGLPDTLGSKVQFLKVKQIATYVYVPLDNKMLTYKTLFSARRILQNIYWLVFLSEQFCFPLALSFCQCSVQISNSKGSLTVTTNGIILEIIQQNWCSSGNVGLSRKIMLIIFISQTTAKQDLGKSPGGMEAVRQDRRTDRLTDCHLQTDFCFFSKG